jgi:hypothetical protein
MPLVVEEVEVVEVAVELNLQVLVSHLVHFHSLESVEVGVEEVYEQVLQPLVLP